MLDTNGIQDEANLKVVLSFMWRAVAAFFISKIVNTVAAGKTVIKIDPNGLAAQLPCHESSSKLSTF